MRKFYTVILILCFSIPVISSENALIDLAEHHYNRKEYYNAITESMRYQFLYPKGVLFPQSMLIMGKSYFKGGNRQKAFNLISDCYNKFTNTREGETALFYSGLMRIESGSYNYAVRNFQEYNYVYNKGIFHEDAIINLSLAYALAENYEEAEKKLQEYNIAFPDGRLLKKAEEMSLAMESIKIRPKKSLLAAGLLSAFIPGSGYFYTEEYMLGVFSFLTNSALIYGIYDGYKKKDMFQIIFFSVIEFSFYNYSLFGSIKSADEYNEASDYKKELLLGLKTNF